MKKIKGKPIFLAFGLIFTATLVLLFTFAIPIRMHVDVEDLQFVFRETITYEDIQASAQIDTDATILYLLFNDRTEGGLLLTLHIAEYLQPIESGFVIDIHDVSTNETISTILVHQNLSLLYIHTTAFNDDIYFEGGFSFEERIGVLVLDLDAGNDYYTADHSALGKTHILGGNGDDNFDVGHGNYTIDCGQGNDTFYHRYDTGTARGVDNMLIVSGGEDNDAFSLGGPVDNIIDGGNGDDTITGNTGNDTLLGKRGNDIINGGFGNDIINGGSGNDTINGGNGDDTLLGREGNDVIEGDYGNDVLWGGPGSDSLYGGPGADTLVPETGDAVRSS